MPEHYATLFDAGYLPQGLSLHGSMKRHAGDFVLWVLCMDEEAYKLLVGLAIPEIRPLRLAELETPELLAIKPTRSRAEYCWTLTPFLPSFVFAKDPSIERVTYLDADMFFRKSPEPIFRELEDSGKSILITEHDFDPKKDRANVFGRFCVQFLTYTRGAKCTEVLEWWQEKCLEWCFYRKEPDRFGDQKYLDQWPKLFPDAIHILQHKELLAAPWNALRRDARVCLYHFHSLRLIDRGKVRLWSGYWLSPKNVEQYYRAYLQELSVQIPKIPSHLAGRIETRWYPKLLVWKNQFFGSEKVLPIPFDKLPNEGASPKIVLHACTAFRPQAGYGGPATVMSHQIRELSQNPNFALAGISLGSPELGPLPQDVELVPVWARVMMLRFSGWLPGSLAQVRKAVAAADVVHIHFGREAFPVAVASVCQKIGKPYVLQTHGMLTTVRRSRAWVHSILDWFLVRKLVEGADVVFALQEIEAAMLRMRFPKACIRILPNGIPIHNASKNTHPSHRISFLSRFTSRKKPLDLVDAFRQISPSIKAGWELFLAGPDDGEMKEVQSRAKGMEFVQIHGPMGQEQVRQILENTEIYVLPSVEEPFPMGVLEAMATGLCVVVTKGCHIAKDLELADAAEICEPDPESLARTLTRLMRDPERRKLLGKNAKEIAKKNYSMTSVGKLLTETYTSIS